METSTKKLNPSRRILYCKYDFCLNDCAECNEMSENRKIDLRFNPSKRYQKAKNLPYLEAGKYIITKAEWKGDAYYFEATRKYRIKRI